MRHFLFLALLTAFSFRINAEEEVQIVAQLNESKSEFVVTIINNTHYNIDILNQIGGAGGHNGSLIYISKIKQNGEDFSMAHPLWLSDKRYDLKRISIGKSLNFIIPKRYVLEKGSKLKRAQVYIVVLYTNPSNGEVFSKYYWVDFEIVK